MLVDRQQTACFVLYDTGKQTKRVRSIELIDHTSKTCCEEQSNQLSVKN